MTVHLPIAVRAFTRSKREARDSPARRDADREWPRDVLILDTETTTETTQRLLFGSYRLCEWDGLRLVCREEGLLFADDLRETDPEGFAGLEEYARTHLAEVGPGGHHFGTAHTGERYRTAFYPSTLADRLGYDAWATAGGEDAARRANRVWKEILAAYEQPPLDTATAEALDDYVARRGRELENSRLYD